MSEPLSGRVITVSLAVLVGPIGESPVSAPVDLESMLCRELALAGAEQDRDGDRAHVGGASISACRTCGRRRRRTGAHGCTARTGFEVGARRTSDPSPCRVALRRSPRRSLTGVRFGRLVGRPSPSSVRERDRRASRSRDVGEARSCAIDAPMPVPSRTASVGRPPKNTSEAMEPIYNVFDSARREAADVDGRPQPSAPGSTRAAASATEATRPPVPSSAPAAASAPNRPALGRGCRRRRSPALRQRPVLAGRVAKKPRLRRRRRRCRADRDGVVVPVPR